MMRSLWTAASGMVSQQQNVDTISNNLANVNTNGYKKERMEFKTLLYDTIQRADLDAANRTGRPVNLQVGGGVRPVATARIFSQGNLERTDYQLDLAIQGDGFFVVSRAQDQPAYTKDGAIKLSPTDEGLMLVTADGYPFLSVDDEPIYLPNEISVKDVIIQDDGRIFYTDTNKEQIDTGYQLQVVQFTNVQGLEAIGANLYSTTPAVGNIFREVDGEVNKVSVVMQGVLELSNVLIANEMVNLIVAQRAYELNSKAITTSDDMLQQANNLKRQ